MKVKASVMEGARQWLKQNDFVEVTPPILTQNACEGGVTLFKLKYFDREAYLSQSAQMYLEALIFSLDRVYSLTPSFRAEKSRTTRHLTEYWHLELEEAWVDNKGNMEIQESLVTRHGGPGAAGAPGGADAPRPESRRPEGGAAARSRAGATPTCSTELSAKGHELGFGCDLGAVEERAVTADEKVPMFVTNFPKECKAFYMKEDEEDPRTVKCADLLAPEGYGEMIGGSERETDVAKLINRHERAQHSRWRRTNGTSTCAASAPCPTPASAWGSSGWSAGSASWSTSGTRYRSPARWPGSIPRPGASPSGRRGRSPSPAGSAPRIRRPRAPCSSLPARRR